MQSFYRSGVWELHWHQQTVKKAPLWLNFLIFSTATQSFTKSLQHQRQHWHKNHQCRKTWTTSSHTEVRFWPAMLNCNGKYNVMLKCNKVRKQGRKHVISSSPSLCSGLTPLSKMVVGNTEVAVSPLTHRTSPRWEWQKRCVSEGDVLFKGVEADGPPLEIFLTDLVCKMPLLYTHSQSRNCP